MTDVRLVKELASFHGRGFDPHFILVSLGNPAPYSETRHSVGHHALQVLQRMIGQPAFTSTRVGGSSAEVSRGPKYTMVQSPSRMNISGRWLRRAFKDSPFTDSIVGSGLGKTAAVVLVHDEMELDLGKVRTRTWDQSAKGHNGVRSVLAECAQIHDRNATPWWRRIGVGIGRPLSREREDVSSFVLSPFQDEESDILHSLSFKSVLDHLRTIELEWAKAWEKEQEQTANDLTRDP